MAFWRFSTGFGLARSNGPCIGARRCQSTSKKEIGADNFYDLQYSMKYLAFCGMGIAGSDPRAKTGFYNSQILGDCPGGCSWNFSFLRGRFTPLSFLRLSSGGTWKMVMALVPLPPDPGLTSLGFAFLTASRWNAPERSLQLRYLHRCYIQPAPLRKQWTSLKIGYCKFLKL
jgi:hypothetical protein